MPQMKAMALESSTQIRSCSSCRPSLDKRGVIEMLTDLGTLVLRVVTGSLLAGHGAQKLFGAFQGPGLQTFAESLGTRGFRPGLPWAFLGSASEFAGGGLTALGLFHPLGPIISMAPMVMATRTSHWGKPIWVSRGGAELPLINMSASAAVALGGPGRFSLDRLLGIRLPAWMVALSAVGTGAGITFGLIVHREASRRSAARVLDPAPGSSNVGTGPRISREVPPPTQQPGVSHAGG